MEIMGKTDLYNIYRKMYQEQLGQLQILNPATVFQSCLNQLFHHNEKYPLKLLFHSGYFGQIWGSPGLLVCWLGFSTIYSSTEYLTRVFLQ